MQVIFKTDNYGPAYKKQVCMFYYFDDSQVEIESYLHLLHLQVNISTYFELAHANLMLNTLPCVK